MRLTAAAVTVLLAASQTSAAHADEPAAAPQHKFTVMWAPIRLVVPLAEFTGEYRVQDKVGVSVELGAGRRTIAGPSGSNVKATGTEIEGGVQVRYYVLGSFDKGMELGAEFLYENVKWDQPLPPGVFAVAAGGGTIGPFLGYKVVHSSGFTFEAQLGARYVAMLPAVTGNAPGGFMVDSRWQPLLHVNIGWSF